MGGGNRGAARGVSKWCYLSPMKIASRTIHSIHYCLGPKDITSQHAQIPFPRKDNIQQYALGSDLF